MPKPSSIDRSIEIVLAILRYIPKQGRIHTKDIQAKLEGEGVVVNIRTVQRYLALLCKHYEIEVDDRSKPYGYRWKTHSQRFDVPHLTEQQSLLLALTKKHLEKLLPDNVLASLSALFDRANYQLQHDEKNRLGQEWLSKVCVVPTSQPLLPAAIDEDVLSAVSTALYQNKTLAIEYVNQVGKSHQAQVKPLGLAQQGGNLYLVVKYPWADGERNLALHRIKSAEVTIHSFERPLDFDLETYKGEGSFAWGSGKLIELSFVIEKTHGFHLTETPLSGDQKITEYSPTQYLIQATVFDSEVLDWWLMTFKNKVTMLKKQLIEK